MSYKDLYSLPFAQYGFFVNKMNVLFTAKTR